MQKEEFELHARLEDEHWWFKGRRDIIKAVLEKYLAKDSVVVEIGCGTGGNLRGLAREYPRIFGIEIEEDAVSLAKQMAAIDVYQGDYREILHNRWEEIDAVIMADVIEHVEKDCEFVQTVLENLVTGAHLLITVPAHGFLWSEHDEALGHYRRYSGNELLATVLQKGNAEVVMFTPFNTILFPLIAGIRLVKKAFKHKGGKKSDLKEYSPLLNAILYKLFSREAFLLKRSVVMPFGCSYLVLLRKV